MSESITQRQSPNFPTHLFFKTPLIQCEGTDLRKSVSSTYSTEPSSMRIIKVYTVYSYTTTAYLRATCNIKLIYSPDMKCSVYLRKIRALGISSGKSQLWTSVPVATSSPNKVSQGEKNKVNFLHLLLFPMRICFFFIESTSWFYFILFLLNINIRKGEWLGWGAEKTTTKVNVPNPVKPRLEHQRNPTETLLVLQQHLQIYIYIYTFGRE